MPLTAAVLWRADARCFLPVLTDKKMSPMRNYVEEL